MKERKRPCALTAFSIRLGCVIFLFWLLGLAAITLAISQYIFQGLSEKGIDYAEDAAMVGGLDRLFSAEEEAAERRAQPGAAEYAMNRAIAHAERSIQPPSFAGYPGMSEKLSIFCSQYLRCNTAILVLDSAGEILRSSGDFIYFGYQSEEAWQQGEAEAASGMAWIDLSDVADPRYVRLRSQYGQLHSLDVDVIRITGCWDGSRLEPLSLAVLDIGAYDQALETVCPGWWEQAEDAAAAAMPTEAEAEITISADGRSATVSVSGDSQTPPYTRAELDAMGLLAWDVYFDETASAVMPADAVTIYAFSPEIFVYDAGGPVRYQGSERHENLLALLKTMGFYQDVGRNRFYSGASQFSLWNMIVFSSWQGDDLANEDSFGSGDSPSAEYTLLTAMQASPLRIAAQFLRNVYLFFTAFALVAFWLLRRSLKKNLTAPLQAVVEGMDAGWGYLPQLRDRPPQPAPPPCRGYCKKRKSPAFIWMKTGLVLFRFFSRRLRSFRRRIAEPCGKALRGFAEKRQAAANMPLCHAQAGTADAEPGDHAAAIIIDRRCHATHADFTFFIIQRIAVAADALQLLPESTFIRQRMHGQAWQAFAFDKTGQPFFAVVHQQQFAGGRAVHRGDMADIMLADQRFLWARYHFTIHEVEVGFHAKIGAFAKAFAQPLQIGQCDLPQALAALNIVCQSAKFEGEEITTILFVLRRIAHALQRGKEAVYRAGRQPARLCKLL